MLGAGYLRGLWTYTAGGVFLNKASTDNPVEWGQDNSALFLNLGFYRQMPELSVGGLFTIEVYGGIGRDHVRSPGPGAAQHAEQHRLRRRRSTHQRVGQHLHDRGESQLLRTHAMSSSDAMPTARQFRTPGGCAWLAAGCVALLATAGAVSAAAPDVTLGLAATTPSSTESDGVLPVAEYVTGEAAGKAAPTNQWYSSVMFQRWSQPLHAHPMTYRATRAGLRARPAVEALRRRQAAASS